MDYDSTICLTAISDEIMKEDSVRPGWKEIDDAYVEGRMGSRENLELFMPLLPGDPAPLFATAEKQPHDPAFARFVARARAAGVALEVVSDGFGFYVGHNLERIGVTGMSIATSRMTWPGEHPRIEFPFGHPACRVCGTCKRERVLAYQARGFHVAFVGDGFTDRYAAAHASARRPASTTSRGARSRTSPRGSTACSTRPIASSRPACGRSSAGPRPGARGGRRRRRARSSTGRPRGRTEAPALPARRYSPTTMKCTVRSRSRTPSKSTK
jgi:2-hydroxy-3-keto-5-methylthiopentenyl-1-phosphate phosphatase